MKGLIVSPTTSRIPNASLLASFLWGFGIDSDVMFLDDVVAAGGKSYINANYDFAVFMEYRRADNTGTTGDTAYSWVTYSAGDKPIFYLGGQRRGSVPADFPIRAFNSADTNTFYNYESGRWESNELARKIGTCVQTVDGKYRLWGRFANYTYPQAAPTDYAQYMCEPSQLGGEKEILWQLDLRAMGVSDTPPSNHAVAVRYYNRYFLPQTGYDVTAAGILTHYGMARRLFGLSLFLWALSHAGIKPSWRIPLWLEIDHPIAESGYVGYTETQRMQLTRQVLGWLRDFCKENGFFIVAGLTTHQTRDSSWGHQKMLANYEDARVANEILRLMEREGTLAACWHDHSAELGATGFSYTRHSGGSYGVPSSVTDVECNFGTGAIATMNLRSLTPLRVHIEDQEAWVKAWGFQDAWSGQHRHINCANNSYGGWQVLSLLRKYWGLRSVRVLMSSVLMNPTQGGTYRHPVYYGLPMMYDIGGVFVMPSEDLHYSSHRGIYNPGGGGGNDTDLNTYMGYGATSGVQARRRHLALQGDLMVNYPALGGTTYIHNFSWHAASLNDPFGDYNTTGNWNGLCEAMWMLKQFIDALPDWFTVGGPAEMQQVFRRYQQRYGRIEIGL